MSTKRRGAVPRPKSEEQAPMCPICLGARSIGVAGPEGYTWLPCKECKGWGTPPAHDPTRED